MFVILLVLIYHLVVLLIKIFFLNLGGVKDLKKLRILVLNFALFYLKMILKLMVKSWGLLMHLFWNKLLNETSYLKNNKTWFLTNLSSGCKSIGCK